MNLAKDSHDVAKTVPKPSEAAASAPLKAASWMVPMECGNSLHEWYPWLIIHIELFYNKRYSITNISYIPLFYNSYFIIRDIPLFL